MYLIHRNVLCIVCGLHFVKIIHTVLKISMESKIQMKKIPKPLFFFFVSIRDFFWRKKISSKFHNEMENRACLGFGCG